MINKNDYINIGKIKKKFGKNGEFILGVLPNLDINELSDTLFLEINNAELLPVFVENYSYKPPDDLRIKFEFPFESINIDYYLGKSVFVEKSFISKDNYNITDFDLTGWEIMIPQKNIKTKVNSIVNTKMQTLIVVLIDGKEVMIPFHEDFIKNVNVNKNSITLILPEGLLEIN